MFITLNWNFLKIFLLNSGSLIQAEPLIGNNITKVKKGKYPFVVSLAYKDDLLPEEQLHYCTGVLVTKMFVLTAAHCLDDVTLNEIWLIVGSVDLRVGRKYTPSMWITYKQWTDRKNITNNETDNDIAMIKVNIIEKPS